MQNRYVYKLSSYVVFSLRKDPYALHVHVTSVVVIEEKVELICACSLIYMFFYNDLSSRI